MRSALILFCLLVAVGSVATAQMDMLPQIFRDLPPELQEGLPEQMTYVEYRQLNRNVDFFTMFMSMFIPGYGAFQVERPSVGWSIVGVRTAGTALMGAAVAFQWNHFYEIWNDPALDSLGFQRFLTNAFLFGGGLLINGFAWAADVTYAYHVAKSEKDRVQYTYGIRSTISRTGLGESSESADERYLRRLLRQSDDILISSELKAALVAFTEDHPTAPFASEALYFLALLAAEAEMDADALALALRSFRVYPDGVRRNDCVRLMSLLVNRNRADWRLSMDDVTALTSTEYSDDPADLRAFSVLTTLTTLSQDTQAMRVAALGEARAFLEAYPTSTMVPDALMVIAHLESLQGNPQDAASYLAAAIIGWQDHPNWNHAALELGLLYLGPLSDRVNGEIVLRALIERSPESEPARLAREALPRR